MNSNLNPTIARMPSAFGMPTCGHAIDLSSHGSDAFAVTTAAVLEREAGFVKAYAPATRAWRPPIS